jgi:uncharacterized membrane protein
MERNKKKFQLFVSILFLVLFTFFLYTAYHTPAIPVSRGMASMDFPKFLLIAMLIFSAIQLVLSITWFVKNRPQAAEKEEKKAPIMEKKAIITAVLICVYAALWNLIGFSLSTFVYFIVQTKVLDPKKPVWRIALISLIAVVIMNVVFVQIFRVSFPEPLLSLIRGY